MACFRVYLVLEKMICGIEMQEQEGVDDDAKQAAELSYILEESACIHGVGKVVTEV